MTASKGVISIHKRHSNGRVESLRLRARGSFRQATQFDRNQISIRERRKLETDMHRSGMSQAEIADLLGVSQATVSLDLKKINKK
jgi:transcriptional antiterminator